MCRHFDLNFPRGLERLFLVGVDTKDLNRGLRIIKWNGPMSESSWAIISYDAIYFSVLYK